MYGVAYFWDRLSVALVVLFVRSDQRDADAQRRRIRPACRGGSGARSEHRHAYRAEHGMVINDAQEFERNVVPTIYGCGRAQTLQCIAVRRPGHLERFRGCHAVPLTHQERT